MAAQSFFRNSKVHRPAFLATLVSGQPEITIVRPVRPNPLLCTALTNPHYQEAGSHVHPYQSY